jgi:pyruvate dehydrogenase E1 component alpha subunit
MGAALAAQQLNREQVSVGFCGDGAVNTGRTWESINMAALWQLPLLVICENNQYAVETPIDRVMAGGSITDRASGFGLPAIQVDGQDALATNRVVRDARQRALAGEGPTFIEAVTYRYEGHSTGQVVTYRSEDEVALWRDTRDPILRLAKALDDAGHLTSAQFAAITERAKATVADSIEFAGSQPWPDASTAASGVTGLTFELQGNPQ